MPQNTENPVVDGDIQAVPNEIVDDRQALDTAPVGERIHHKSMLQISFGPVGTWSAWRSTIKHLDPMSDSMRAKVSPLRAVAQYVH